MNPETLRDVYIVIEDYDVSIMGVSHEVGFDLKPYCGASLEGRTWRIIDHVPTLSEGAVSCGDCTLKYVLLLMEPTP